MSGLDGVTDDGEQIETYRLEINRVAQPGRERRDGRVRVVPRPVESAIH